MSIAMLSCHIQSLQVVTLSAASIDLSFHFCCRRWLTRSMDKCRSQVVYMWNIADTAFWRKSSFGSSLRPEPVGKSTLYAGSFLFCCCFVCVWRLFLGCVFLLLCFVHKPLRLASLDIVFRGFVFVGEASFMFHFPLSLGRSSLFFYSFIYLLHFFSFSSNTRCCSDLFWWTDLCDVKTSKKPLSSPCAVIGAISLQLIN